MINDLSSNLATIEAAKAVVADGLLDGRVVDLADAIQAYAQGRLGATVEDQCGNVAQVRAWVRLPLEHCPPHFKSYPELQLLP